MGLKKKKKSILDIGVIPIRPRIRVRNDISRFLKFLILEFECFPFGPFGSDPGFEHIWIRSKRAKREVYERTQIKIELFSTPLGHL
jgi:hypothetical protein